MANLVDTGGWIEWLTDGPLAPSFESALLDPASVITPTCLQFELYKWVKRERDESLALEAIALTERTEVVPLTTGIALEAGDLALEHGLSFADALIYATARHHGAMLVTGLQAPGSPARAALPHRPEPRHRPLPVPAGARRGGYRPGCPRRCRPTAGIARGRPPSARWPRDR